MLGKVEDYVDFRFNSMFNPRFVALSMRVPKKHILMWNIGKRLGRRIPRHMFPASISFRRAGGFKKFPYCYRLKERSE